MQKLEFLYYFSCESLVVLEAKILGIDEGTPPDQVYHWLCYERSSGQFEKLTFKAMDTKDDKNFREFAQAELSFDTANARLQIRTQEFILTVHKANSVPEQFTSHVQQFLLG